MAAPLTSSAGSQPSPATPGPHQGEVLRLLRSCSTVERYGLAHVSPYEDPANERD